MRFTTGSDEKPRRDDVILADICHHRRVTTGDVELEILPDDAQQLSIPVFFTQTPLQTKAWQWRAGDHSG